MFLHLCMSVHTSILQLDLSRILGTRVLLVSVLFFFFCSKGVLEFEVMYENFVSKNKNTPRFLLLFNYCRCSFQTKLLSANCRLVSYQQRVCVHGVCWWLSIRVFMTRFQVRIFMTSSTSRIRSVFYEVFLLFAYTIFFNSPPLICCILLYLSKEFLLIY